MKLIQVAIILAAFLMLPACNAMKGQSDMENIIRLMEQDNPSEFEAVMHSFVKNAKLGNADKMIALTSQVTIDKMGVNSLRSHYLKDTIPALKACKKISKGGDIIHVSKAETGTGPGWVYRKTCTYGDEKSVQIQFVILNENGRIAITSFGLA